MSRFRRWSIRRSGPDSFRVALSAEERDLLRHLLPQLRDLVAGDAGAGDPRTRRVFPTAYASDPELDEEYQRLMRDELVASHEGAIARVEATIDAETLTEGELLGWMQSVNAVRLVLGTMLDLSEDDDMSDVDEDDPAAHHYALYGYLSGLLDEMVGAITA